MPNPVTIGETEKRLDHFRHAAGIRPIGDRNEKKHEEKREEFFKV